MCFVFYLTYRCNLSIEIYQYPIYHWVIERNSFMSYIIEINPAFTLIFHHMLYKLLYWYEILSWVYSRLQLFRTYL